MAKRDEIIRLLLELEGESDVAKMTGALRTLEKQGGETGAAAGRLADEFEQLQAADKAASAFVKLKASIADTDDRITKAKAGLAALNAEFSESDRTSGAVSKQYARAEKELARLVDQYHRQQVELQRANGALDKAGIDTTKLGDAQRRLQTQMAGVSDRARTLATGMRNAGDASERAGRQADRAGGILDRLRGFIAPLVAALGFRELMQGAANLLGLGNAAERLERQFARATGGIAQGREALAEIRAIANDTGTDFDVLASTAAKLKNFGIDPLTGALQSMLDQNAAVAGSQEDLEGKILALGQAWAKQKLQGEEALQLMERGVPVWELLSRTTGKNVTELQKLSEAGKLGRNEIKLLIDQIGKENAGAAKDGVLGDITAQATILRNELKKIGEDLVRDGALETSAEGLAKITDRLRDLAQSPEFERLRSAITLAADAGGQALDRILASDKIALVVSQIATITEGIANLTKISSNVGGAVSDGVQAALLPYLKLNELWGDLLRKGAEVTDQWRKHREEVEKQQPAVQAVADSVAALDADINRLQISTRTAGETLVQEARDASAAFIQLATDSNAAGAEILAAFDREVLLAKTREEVQRLGEGLRVAFEAGKIGADEYEAAAKRADDTTKGMAGTVDGLAQRAAATWKALQEAIANGESPERVAELQEKFRQLNEQIKASEQSTHGMNAALGDTQGAVFSLDEAFKELGLKSKASLEGARDAAGAAFEAIRAGAKEGTAATEDVSRAWEVYARRVMDVARLSGESAEKQAAQQLRAQAAALGLTDAYEKLGIAGAKAGDDTARSSDRATDALRDTEAAAIDAAGAMQQTSAAADDAARSADSLASSAQQVQVNLIHVADQAGVTAGELGDVSDKFRQLLADRDLYQGGGARLFFDYQQQTRELEEHVRLINMQADALDPYAQKLEAIRSRWTLLGDSQIDQVARAEERLAQLQKQAAEAEQRQREQAAAERERQRQASVPPAGGSGGGVGGGGTNAAPIVQQHVTVIGDLSPAARKLLNRQLARGMDDELRRIRGLRG